VIRVFKSDDLWTEEEHEECRKEENLGSKIIPARKLIPWLEASYRM
jgi:hypothetical protein